MDAFKRSVGLAVAAALALPSAAAASQPPVVVAIEQASRATTSYFKLRAAPGKAAMAGRLVLRNPTRRRVRVAIDPLNALTATTLGSAYDVRGLKAQGPATWLLLGMRRVVLPPRGRWEVPVTVRLPRDTAPGDYLSGIGIQVLGRARTERNAGVAVASVQRYAIGVAVRVPGPRNPELVLESARVERQPSGMVFLLHARNAGNTTLTDVTGRVVITRGGRRVAQARVGPGTFVSGTAIDFPVPARAEEPRHYETYRLRGFMRYGDGKVARIDTKVEFGAQQAKAQVQYGGPAATAKPGPPWWLALVAAALLGLTVMVWRRSVARGVERAIKGRY